MCWCGRGIWVLLYEPGFLRDHVGDATDDGIGDTKLLVYQLIGVSVVPGEGQEQHNVSMVHTVVQHFDELKYYFFNVY